MDYTAYLTSSSPYAGPDWGQTLAKSSHTGDQNSINDVEEYLLKALASEGADDYENAVGAYRYVIDQYGDTEYGAFALARLMACRVKQGDITVEKDYLNSVQQTHNINSTGITALFWQPLIEARAGNKEEALDFCDNIKNRYSDSNLIKEAKFLKASIQLYELNDIAEAKKTFAEFAQQYPKDPLTEQIKIILENYLPVESPLPKIQPEKKKAFSGIPTNFYLSQNYPNPFNPETEISFQLPNQTHVSLVIYNLLGQKIRTLIDKEMATGYHTIKWHGRNDFGNTVASGVYLYAIQAGEFFDVKKMVLMQ